MGKSDLFAIIIIKEKVVNKAIISNYKPEFGARKVNLEREN
jgi:hypothetical protein